MNYGRSAGGDEPAGAGDSGVPLPPAGDFAHAAWGAEERDQVRPCQTVLIHEMADLVFGCIGKPWSRPTR